MHASIWRAPGASLPGVHPAHSSFRRARCFIACTQRASSGMHPARFALACTIWRAPSTHHLTLYILACIQCACSWRAPSALHSGTHAMRFYPPCTQRACLWHAHHVLAARLYLPCNQRTFFWRARCYMACAQHTCILHTPSALYKLACTQCAFVLRAPSALVSGIHPARIYLACTQRACMWHAPRALAFVCGMHLACFV